MPKSFPPTIEGGVVNDQGLAGITTSVDGFVAGPDDGPGVGLGQGGERLHYWVFGGPWTYDDEPEGEPPRRRRMVGRGDVGSRGRRQRTVDVRGRRALGRQESLGLPFFIVTHRPEEQPGRSGDFAFRVPALRGRPSTVPGGRPAARTSTSIGDGADVDPAEPSRRGLVDELVASSSPRSSSASGRRLFDRLSTGTLEASSASARASTRYATFIDYAVKRS